MVYDRFIKFSLKNIENGILAESHPCTRIKKKNNRVALSWVHSSKKKSCRWTEIKSVSGKTDISRAISPT